MKTFKVRVTRDSEDELIEKVLETMERRGAITFEELNQDKNLQKTTPATDEQVQEIIDEAELIPYYSEKEAKDILNL
ncbi:hypothetical protein [Dyadobacter luticola]|uniref:Uncharacterized protein n=1 Tax=Dyadobacter luticola TaxID=1979387 RepID=A0A5R9KY62_9BACT|nr:hypothetical protein [Dyadobacter luticola]TLV01037.1 hypothetical protein FEN17_16380 [Dyadobacter luticola]